MQHHVQEGATGPVNGACKLAPGGAVVWHGASLAAHDEAVAARGGDCGSAHKEQEVVRLLQVQVAHGVEDKLVAGGLCGAGLYP